MTKTITLELDAMTMAAVQNALHLGILQFQTTLLTVQAQTQLQLDAKDEPPPGEQVPANE